MYIKHQKAGRSRRVFAGVSCCYLCALAILSYLDWLRNRKMEFGLFAVELVPILALLAANIVLSVRGYYIDETGITVKRGLGITKRMPWDAYVFVGPAYIYIKYVVSKNIFCARSLPKCDSDGRTFIVPENAIPIQDSLAMREALRRYCPIYTEEYEFSTLRTAAKQ